jgi:DNA-directed RNA polymerase specialized sigma24 family protein
MSDASLVRRLPAGEELAFEDFFAEFVPRLFRFASARVNGDDDLAEDAVQATLVRAMTDAGDTTGDCPLCPDPGTGDSPRKQVSRAFGVGDRMMTL